MRIFRDKSLEDLLSLDAKDFELGDYKAVIAQVNAVDVEDVLGRQEELENLLNKNVAENGLDLFFFVVTDILNNDSAAVAVGQVAEACSKSIWCRQSKMVVLFYQALYHVKNKSFLY